MKVRATKKNGLPIRGERSYGARVEIVDTLAFGEEFEAVEEYDGWLYVEGKGWCDAYHTEPVEFGGSGGGAVASPMLKCSADAESGAVELFLHYEN